MHKLTKLLNVTEISLKHESFAKKKSGLAIFKRQSMPFFLQYDAEGNCAGAGVHVVHSNFACARLVKYINSKSYIAL